MSLQGSCVTLPNRTEVAQSRVKEGRIGASVEDERNPSSSAIRRWLNDLGLGQYGDAFEQNDLDVDVLRDLSELDLEKIGVSLGHRKKLIRAIAALGPPSALRPARDRRPMDDAASPTGERRQATVLFSDLSGYTAMNEALDPEDVERVMSRIKSDAVVIVERHGGLVNQFIGDEVVALFGIASAHEDDPVRAVRTALELHEMVRTITPELEQRLGQRIRLHTGINTGLVVTHTGDARDGRYRLTGDAVNIGARLRALAKPDEILLSPDTERLTSAFFTTVPHTPVTLKGKREPVVPYCVAGKTQVSSRFEAAKRRGLTPFTGRSHEIDKLNSCLEKALDGRGQLVTVGGDPGAGKSRLVFEFRGSLDLDHVLLFEARCQFFGRDVSYQPFIEVLRRRLRLNDIDNAEQLLEAAITNVVAIDPELARYLPHYLELLSIQSDKYRMPPKFEGGEKRRAFEEALAALFSFASQARPVVLLLEDWHWADEASESALSYLIGMITKLPVLVLVNYRPEYEEHWANLGHHTSLVLKPLDPDDTETLMALSLGVTVIPDGLCRLISTRTGGNPLFVEEVCRSLIEDGTIRVEGQRATLTRPAEELVLPDTVKAVIRGRLDRLEEDAQEPLRLAAVIGREFSKQILERIHPHPARLDQLLASLVAQDLVQRVRVEPEIEYSFKHVLVQAVVYETLLLRRRRELHALVGQAIEGLYADRLPQFHEALAHHFDLGEAWEKAAIYRVRAGIKAQQHHVIRSALKQFDRAKEILANHAPDVAWQIRYDLALHRGEALGEIGQWPAAYDEISEAERLANGEGDLGLGAMAKIARANAAFWAHKFDDSLRAMAELEQLVGGDPSSRLGITTNQAMSNFMIERLATTLAKEVEMNELFLAAPRSPYRSQAAFTIGVFHRWRGDNVESAKFLELAVTHQEKKATAGEYLQSLMHYCLALGEQGKYQAAIDLLLKGRDHGLAADSLYGLLKITNTLGWAYQEVCNFEKAIDCNLMSITSTAEARGSSTSTLSEIDSFARLNLGDVYLTTGEVGRAREYFEAVFQNIGNVDFFLARTRWKPRCLLGLGELWLRLGDLDKAEAFLADMDAHGFTAQFPFKKHQIRAARLRAGILAARNETDAAIETLKTALGSARSYANPTQLWKTHVALGDLLAENGKESQARPYYAAARTVVESVADGLTDPTLKGGFLQASPIRAVLSKAQL